MRYVVLAVAALLAATPAFAQHGAQHGAPSGSGGRTANLQGGDPRQFMNNPHMHAFYDLSVATLGPKAPAKPDIAAYEQKAFVIFNAFGEMMQPGGGPGMVDHLKLIPRQVVQIAKDDPHVLDSFDDFVDAMVGPK